VCRIGETYEMTSKPTKTDSTKIENSPNVVSVIWRASGTPQAQRASGTTQAQRASGTTQVQRASGTTQAQRASGTTSR
jgi:hypothetical protein